MEKDSEISIEGGTATLETSTLPAIHQQIMSLDSLMSYADMLSKSTIVPVSYQNRPENCLVALDMASRMGLSPMVVMQNLYVIQGKPSFSGQAIASMIRANPQFTNIELNFVGTEGTDSWGAYISAQKVSTGKIIKGATVTVAIAKKEGWYQKSGSKWQTMPEIMLSYRAYAWFGRVYCPELLMGLQSTEEVYDTENFKRPTVSNPYENGGTK